jgi:hypothetical protein
MKRRSASDWGLSTFDRVEFTREEQMTNHRNRSAAPCLTKARIVSAISGLLLAACGGGSAGGTDGGGADPGGGAGCLQGTPGKVHALACSTNGLPPDALAGLSALVGLQIQETSPVDGGTAVAVTAAVRVTFTAAMVTAPNIVVSDRAGHVVAGTVTIDGANVMFTPSSPLSPATVYSVVVDGGTSVLGQVGCGVLASSYPGCHLEFVFTTAA